jgi:curved DNA-binding protein CbpA
MLNYYNVLGVPHDASERIVKIAYEGKQKALAKAGLSESARRGEERLLEQAYVTLSNPGKRTWHDKQLATEEASASKAAQSRTLAGWLTAGALAILLIVGGGYYSVNRSIERERLRLEELRIANAKAKDEARAAEEQERLAAARAALDYRQQTDASRRSSQDRAYMDRQGRYNRDSSYQEAVRSRTLNSWDTRESNAAEDRNRYLSDADRRKAWQEVERQKRFVEEREREEERVRTERYYRVQRETEMARARESSQAPADYGTPLPPRVRR